jgi:hypothetical protein
MKLSLPLFLVEQKSAPAEVGHSQWDAISDEASILLQPFLRQGWNNAANGLNHSFIATFSASSSPQSPLSHYETSSQSPCLLFQDSRVKMTMEN